MGRLKSVYVKEELAGVCEGKEYVKGIRLLQVLQPY